MRIVVRVLIALAVLIVAAGSNDEADFSVLIPLVRTPDYFWTAGYTLVIVVSIHQT
jgi:hypothetical protein